MQKYKLNHTGSILLVSLLALILIGAGVLMYMRVSDSTTDTDNNTNTNQTNPSNNTSQEIPDGFVEYINEDLGISFSYPGEWGEPQVTILDEQDDSVEQGSIVRGTFSLSSDIAQIVFGMNSRNYISAPRGGGPVDYQGYVAKNGDFVQLFNDVSGEPVELGAIDNAKAIDQSRESGIIFEYEDQNYSHSTAIFNLKNSIYSSLNFDLAQPQGQVDEDLVKMFERMTQTFNEL